MSALNSQLPRFGSAALLSFHCWLAAASTLGCAPAPQPQPPKVETHAGAAGGIPTANAAGAPLGSPLRRSFQFPFQDPSLPLAERTADLVGRMSAEEKVAQMLDQAPAIQRLGVPAYSWWNEALHGVARHGKATVFPQAIGMAATFDAELIRRVATAISDEARAKFNAATELGNDGKYAGLTFWSPNINIFRDPRWGRGQETWGEDPFLTSRLGVAFVRGLQGEDPSHLKTAACAKHFAVHSGPEASRHTFDARPSRKDLVETYLPAFEALVSEGNVAGVMSAYNRVYGEPASGSPYLLKDLLRKAWGFQGYVVSDCGALADIHKHHRVTSGPAESAALALKAGVNVNCGSIYRSLGEALSKGLVTEAELDQALSELLSVRFRLGLFDPDNPYAHLGPEVVGSDAHHALAKRVAVQSLVLLKNDKGVLPLNKKSKRLLLLGPYAADGYVSLGNYFGIPARLTTLLEGMGSAVHPGTTLNYKYAFLPDRENINPIDWSTGLASDSDAVVVTVGLSALLESEEGAAKASPHKGDRVDLGLPKPQVAYLKRLRKASNTPVIAVVFGGSPIDLEEIEPLVDAILFAWYPGQAGGEAIADVLFGNASPGGRLPITFPRSVKDLPPFDDYSMGKRTYRFAEAEPLYPFGYGMSYARVEYQAITLSAGTVKAGGHVSARVTLHNHSSHAASEVLQLYLRDEKASTRVPRVQLVAFQRVTIPAKAQVTVELPVPARSMQIVHQNGTVSFEPGWFELVAASAAPSQRSQELGSHPVSARFQLVR